MEEKEFIETIKKTTEKLADHIVKSVKTWFDDKGIDTQTKLQIIAGSISLAKVDFLSSIYSNPDQMILNLKDSVKLEENIIEREIFRRNKESLL